MKIIWSSSFLWIDVPQRSQSIWYFSILSRKSFFSTDEEIFRRRKYCSSQYWETTHFHPISANSHAGSPMVAHSQSIIQQISESFQMSILLGLILSPWIRHDEVSDNPLTICMIFSYSCSVSELSRIHSLKWVSRYLFQFVFPQGIHFSSSHDIRLSHWVWTEASSERSCWK